jgi:penicillin-binding protein 1A
MLAAIGIANEHRDTPGTLYQDTNATQASIETCEKGNSATPLGRRALVSFACSLNRPLEWRTAQLGQDRIKHLIDGFGFTMPPVDRSGEGTPPSTAVVRGLIARTRQHTGAGANAGADV